MASKVNVNAGIEAETPANGTAAAAAVVEETEGEMSTGIFYGTLLFLLAVGWIELYWIDSFDIYIYIYISHFLVFFHLLND